MTGLSRPFGSRPALPAVVDRTAATLDRHRAHVVGIRGLLPRAPVHRNRPERSPWLDEDRRYAAGRQGVGSSLGTGAAVRIPRVTARSTATLGRLPCPDPTPIGSVKVTCRSGMAQRIQATLSLLQQALAGDDAASTALLGFYRIRLERFLAGRLPSASRSLLDTPDLVQEILTRAWNRLPEFEHRGPGSLWGFLRASALHRVADEYRRVGRNPEQQYLTDTTALDESVNGRSPLDSMQHSEAFSAYEAALEQLDTRLRTAIQLRMELGTSFEQIAQECGYPSAEAARKAVSRGLQEVARTINKAEGDEGSRNGRPGEPPQGTTS